MSWAVELSIALIWSGVAVGNFCRSRATTPDTTAVDSDVPLPRWKRVPTLPVATVESTNDPGTRRPITCDPGATTSTPRVALPCWAKSGMLSSASATVLLSSSAPTARIVGLYAGSASDVVDRPSLPAAATTTMPLRHATSAA
jgi:hypothetical protein